MRAVRISERDAEAVVNTLGSHVVSVSLGGRPVVKPNGDGSQTHGGIAVLMPYAGRVRHGEYRFGGLKFRLPVGREGNAIHGFAKDAVWKVLKEERRSVVLAARLEGSGYPGVLEAVIAYGISRTGFSTDCSVRNVGGRECPLVVGFHPYFVARDWRVSAGTAYRYSLRDGFFPDGKRAPYSFDEAGPNSRLDDCFWVRGEIRLFDGERSLVIGRRAMPYLVVYNGKYAEGKSVAIEPYTGLPDAFNNGIGLRTLKPGRAFSCGYSFVLDQA